MKNTLIIIVHASEGYGFKIRICDMKEIYKHYNYSCKYMIVCGLNIVNIVNSLVPRESTVNGQNLNYSSSYNDTNFFYCNLDKAKWIVRVGETRLILFDHNTPELYMMKGNRPNIQQCDSSGIRIL